MKHSVHNPLLVIVICVSQCTCICSEYFDIENNISFRHIVSQSPAIMHMLDKSGSCGKFDNYQRPEGFPVGTCR